MKRNTKRWRSEVALRARVYPGFVARGKMKEAVADRELAIMRAIARDYESAGEEGKGRRNAGVLAGFDV